jgi:hypothetical protein
VRIEIENLGLIEHAVEAAAPRTVRR